MSRRSSGKSGGRGGVGLPILGFFLGGLCGFITYWSGAAIIATPDLMQLPTERLPYEFLRPFHTFTYWEAILVGIGGVFGITVARYRWRSMGLLSYIGLVSVIAGFLVYSWTVSIPKVPDDQRWLSYILFAAEAGGLGLIVVFSFYSLDAATRKRWTRRPEIVPWDPKLTPKAAFVVPIFNEPVELVEQTLAHLVRQEYPDDRYVVVCADDSTDPEVRQGVEEACRRLGVWHVTREDRRGFKAGAINHVERLLPEDIELISVIDADYWVAPAYLRSVVGYFTDPALSFVQTPQDYRNVEESFLTRRYKRAEAYFYHGIMPSRNEQNTIIFCGTMGILRREAMRQVGGFAEDQICEDAEISVRLAADGWKSLYVDRTFGRGLMPAVFESYKKQFYRWAFGNVRILFTRTGTILRSRMSVRQKFDYLVSNLHWFDGFFVITIAAMLVYLGLAPVFGWDAVTHHQRELLLLGLVPVVLLIDGMVRLHSVLGRAERKSFGDTILVMGMWFAIKMTNLSAVIKCMLGFKTPFIRTPKDPSHRLPRFRAFFRAIRLTKVESLFGSVLIATAVLNAVPTQWATPGQAERLLAVWLVVYGLFFLAAPIYAYLSYRTLRPIDHEGVPLERIHSERKSDRPLVSSSRGRRAGRSQGLQAGP
ncbi:MAG: glycosyltransferase [Euryarchaeota archaeon]|nr:glycosyltransferase [Euryarchaeota archaeon]